MNYRMKYVIIDTHLAALPIVFSELQQHADVAQAFARRPEANESWKNVVIGAGFCHVKVEEIVNEASGQRWTEPRFVCYGESVSLGVKSRGDEDSKFLNKYLGVVHD